MGAHGPLPGWEEEAERRDRAADQRDEDATARDDLAAGRDHASGGRDALASDRDLAAHERETAALVRDWEATGRDHVAERRDRAAGRRARPTDASQLGRFEQAAVDGELEASDRQAAAEDRSGAAGDREQAAVERAQHGYVPTSGGPPFRRVQAARGRARETAQAAAGATADLVEQTIQAKQREAAAHLAAVEVYEQLATLQEGLGHPERAAEARAKAERAREFHRLAGAELAEYLARIKAVEDRRARRRRGRDRPGWWVRPAPGDRGVAAGPEGGRRPPAGPALRVEKVSQRPQQHGYEGAERQHASPCPAPSHPGRVELVLPGVQRSFGQGRSAARIARVDEHGRLDPLRMVGGQQQASLCAHREADDDRARGLGRVHHRQGVGQRAAGSAQPAAGVPPAGMLGWPSGGLVCARI
jgi:hypothetical protein